jgi:probable HAF family extracellular repeat protein
MKLHSMTQTSLALAIASSLAVATSQPSNAATMYSALDLGSLGVTDISVSSINNLGQVVGTASQRGFRTAANRPINPVTDYIDTVGNFGLPTDINDSGQVVGFFPNTSSRAFRTAANSPINAATDTLEVNNNITSVTVATGINNAGQVVITQFLLTGAGSRSYRTAANSPINAEVDNIGNLGGVVFEGPPSGTTFSQASGINDLGQVVGVSLNTDLQLRAFRTSPNSAINPATDDLGTLGGSQSEATAINNLGQVVGSSTTVNGETRAFRTAPNSSINAATDNLGTLGGAESRARGINDLGQVVGESTNVNGENRAFLYDQGQIFDLNNLVAEDLGVILNYAAGINNRGQIIAGTSSNTPGGLQRAFLLTPIETTSVPEPSLGLGLLAVVAMSCGFITKQK